MLASSTMVSLTIAPIPAIIKPHPSTPTGPDKTAAKANAARCVAAKSIAIVCTLTKKGCQLSVSTQRPVLKVQVGKLVGRLIMTEDL